MKIRLGETGHHRVDLVKWGNFAIVQPGLVAEPTHLDGRQTLRDGPQADLADHKPRRHDGCGRRDGHDVGELLEHGRQIQTLVDIPRLLQ